MRRNPTPWTGPELSVDEYRILRTTGVGSWDAGGMAATPPTPVRPWYLRPKVAIWLGPVLIVVCVAVRFGWGGLAGPPFPVWSLDYLVGAAGIVLTYVGFLDRDRA
jgi:hypothetical protein